MSFKFLKMKIVNHQVLKMNWRHDINKFWKSWKGLKLVSRLQNWTKNMLDVAYKLK